MKTHTDIQRPMKAKVVLGIGAHPDDLDGMAGGTIAKLTASGATVYYLILTGGGQGSPDRSVNAGDLIRRRQEEQREAARRLGVADVFFADYPDGGLRVDDDVRCDIVKCIRELCPDLVITLDPTVVYDLDREVINHPDHRAAGQAALDAVYPFARDCLSYPDLLAEGYEPHNVSTVMLVNFTSPNYMVDISSTIDSKNHALAAHQSQGFGDPGIQALVRDIAAKAGKKAGCKYAEAFVCFDVHVG